MSQWLGVALFVVVILLVVLVHEGGHFVAAKAFGIKVEEFFVGFGPRLWSTRRGETEYGLKAIPLGGYVRIAGMNPFQELPAEDRPRSYEAKPKWQRALVIFAGPVTHFFIAIVFLAVFFAAIGVPTDRRPVVDAVEPTLGGQTSPAAAAGLRPGDEIVAVDGRPVGSTDRFVGYTRARVGEPLTLTVRRDGEEVTVTAAPVPAEVEGRTVGRLGIILGSARERSGPVEAVTRATGVTWTVARTVVVRLGDIFGPAGLRRIGELLFGGEVRQPTDATSVVGGAQIAGQAAAAGAWDVLVELFAVFNIFIGVLNLLPLPPLDGGHLAVVGLEAVTGRRVDPRKLVPLTALVAGFLILFVVSLVYLDIVNPLPSPFR